MTDLRKAAEMALKFLDDVQELGGPYPYVNGTSIVYDSRQVAAPLRQALTQSEQKREWVGLTDDEIKQIFMRDKFSDIAFAHLIEAKLKEKNT